METKKLSNLVIDFFRNDIVWLEGDVSWGLE
jgi:hypothetical protein